MIGRAVSRAEALRIAICTLEQAVAKDDERLPWRLTRF